jgi:hypothetical protein
MSGWVFSPARSYARLDGGAQGDAENKEKRARRAQPSTSVSVLPPPQRYRSEPLAAGNSPMRCRFRPVLRRWFWPKSLTIQDSRPKSEKFLIISYHFLDSRALPMRYANDR